eukprot:scaffold4936_cov73-Phaeocystis_antarctica.AAC.2
MGKGRLRLRASEGSADTKANTRGGGALEMGDLRRLEDGRERGGALGSDVIASETASEGQDGKRSESIGVSMGADTKANTPGRRRTRGW